MFPVMRIFKIVALFMCADQNKLNDLFSVIFTGSAGVQWNRGSALSGQALPSAKSPF